MRSTTATGSWGSGWAWASPQMGSRVRGEARRNGGAAHVASPDRQRVGAAAYLLRLTISATIALNCSVISFCRKAFDITVDAIPDGSSSSL